MRKLIFCFFMAFHLLASGQVSKESQQKKIQANVSKIANLGPGCRIELKIPSGANFRSGHESSQGPGVAGFSLKMTPDFSSSGDWSFDFNCYKIDDDQVQRGWAVRLPTGGWAPNHENGGRELLENKALRLFSLTAKNSNGWAVAVDDTIGEEKYRQRRLIYCFTREMKAVCGESVVGHLDFLKRKGNIDLTSRALAILRGIEFLEDTPPTPESLQR
ncbi:hypothetical protein GFK26_25175 [Variovorax paradoxus]|uniref:Uncharacterized protein n=1 Tax=Variovorax paradoxus TaxID=34073 RepID=A0A5Q0M8J4_VARPD|nr:hypothetical protein [Variovorax paradoxus]QFZ85826.1 hypothetical protein GFK26_25175 [Variovorax paradoxus]